MQRIIEQQKVEYDFGFYKLPQHTDAPVTILSEGKTLLQTNMGLELPLQPTSSLGELALYEAFKSWQGGSKVHAKVMLTFLAVCLLLKNLNAMEILHAERMRAVQFAKFLGAWNRQRQVHRFAPRLCLHSRTYMHELII